MRIGLLEAETLTAEVMQRFGSYGSMIAALLQNSALIISDSNYDKSKPNKPKSNKPNNDALHLSFKKYFVDQGHLPTSLQECDAYIITGSRCSAFDDVHWINQLKQLIRKIADHQIPLLGICFGHQLIAHTLGGRAERSSKGWGVGVAAFEIYKIASWMQPTLQNLKLLVSHQDQVMQLPADAQLLAGNDFCPNAMFQLGENILCTQAHPEFNASYVEHLINRRRDNIGEAAVQSGLRTLALETDHAIVAQWFVNFLKR